MNFNFLKSIEIGKKYFGKLDVEAMHKHLIETKLFLCNNEKLYIYVAIQGRYLLIPNNSEWIAISYFFSDKINLSISTRQRTELISRLKNTASIQCSDDFFFKEKDVINLKNGVLNFMNKDICEKCMKWGFDYELNVRYMENSSLDMAPNFAKFCNTSLEGDRQKIKLLLQIIGYLCSPLMDAKKCFIILGAPNSGKSVILKFIETIFGIENISHIQMEKLNDKFAAGILSQKRLNICGELSGKVLRDFEFFKMLVGNDGLYGQFKHRDGFAFKNRCKLLFAGNMLPPLKNEDISSAFVDRLVILNFSKSISPEERDYKLLEKLIDERDVIFSLAIGTLSGLIENNYIFAQPEDSKIILEDYSFQQNHIEYFIKENCIIQRDKRIHTKILYEAYEKFCKDNAICPISQILFSQKISSLSGVSSERFRLNGNNLRGFRGIGLL